ncbi:MAG TPA: IS256 family transposase [Bacteroidia bacterium]|nr:IS256 family transposase [Bacteroidia bacterium]
MEQSNKMLDDLIKSIKTPEEFYQLQDALKKRGIEALLNAEMTEHLGYEKHQKAVVKRSNSRNGTSVKAIKTAQGELEINVPRDRDSSFEPVLIPKHRRISEDLEQVILHLYAKGMSTEDISDHMERIYGVAYSASAISTITNHLMADIDQWHQRPLEKIYPVVWLDAIRYKIKQDSRVQSKAILLAIGLKLDGKKEVLGLWIYETESAAFWMEVLNDMKMRGTEDLFIVSSDNLPGLTDAIASVYPQAITQICIVHQIRNSLKHVSWKDRKSLTEDLKQIYQSINDAAALTAFESFKTKWMSKYGYAVKSWEKNWENLTHFLSFPLEIRKIIYTTNMIESFNAILRKFTKNKKVFPNDDAALKSVWLATQQISQKWTMPIRDWGLIVNQFSILFPSRLNLNY